MAPARKTQTAMSSAVVVAVVEQVGGGRGREREGDPGQQHDREHRLGAVGDLLGAVAAQRDEDRARGG